MLSPAEQPRAESALRLARAGATGVPALLEELADPSWAVRRVVVEALAGLGDVAVAPLCELLRDRRDSEAMLAAAVDALAASTGASADAAVLALAGSKLPAVAADAAQILGRRRSAAAVPALTALTLHPDDNVAVAAIEALGRIGGRASVDALIASIESGNFFRVFPAIDVLGRSGDPRAVLPLAGLLADPRYAHEAARALGRSGDRSAVAPLTGLLAHPSDAMVRVSAAALAELFDQHLERYGVTSALDHALRASSSKNAVRRLTQALGRASPAEQAAICRVLGGLGGGDDSIIPALTRLLDAPAPVSSAAAGALQKLGREADEKLLAALLEGDSARRRVLLPLVSGRSSAAPEILRCLTDADAAVRSMACDALARIGHVAAVPSIFQLLADRNPQVAQAAVGAVQSLGSAEAEALTLAAARSAEPQVRRSALRIIGYFGYASALDLVIDAIHQGDERLRDAAVYALPFIDDPRATEALLAAGRDANPRTRAAAMRAFGQCSGAPSIVDALTAGLSDPDAWTRYYACQSLGKLAVEPLSATIAALLNDPAGQVRVAAIEALSHLTSGAAFDALCEAAGSKDVDIERAALVGLGLGQRPAALPILLAAASSPDPATRLVAVSAVAGFDAPSVVPALARAAADADESVRTAAVGFLATNPTAAATRALVDLLRASPHGERILAALSIVPDARSGALDARDAPEARIDGLLAALDAADDELAPRLTSALARMQRPDAWAAVIQALSSPNAPARKAAAATLGAIGTPEAVETLRRASAKDPDPEVRRICALVLSQ